MNAEEKRLLSEMLGPGFTGEELEKILEEYPDLTREAPWLNRHLGFLKEGEVPELPANFSRQVMEGLERPRFWKDLREGWLSGRRLLWVGSFAAAALAGLILVPRFLSVPERSIAFREASAPEEKRTYWVRFTIRLPQAQTVALAGDFNQWNPVGLKPSPQGDGTFALEMPLTGGAYAYAFLVDGKKWVPDPSVKAQVEDGFGNTNSLLNL